MSTIDQQFVEFIVKSLVSKPENVVITRRIDEKGVLLELTVDPEDLGRIIGKRGATAQSLRTLLRALGTKNDARYNLKIVDNDRVDGGEYAAGAPADDATVAGAATSQSAQDTTDEPIGGQAVDDGQDEPVENKDTVTSRTRKELAQYDDLDI